MLITLIGGGNMSTALISGLVNPASAHLELRVCDPSDAARARLEASFDVDTYTDPVLAIEDADVIVLAVKPQSMTAVLDALAGQVTADQLIVSIAAGVTISSICEKLGKTIAVVRCMPNTPALIGQGITGMVAGQLCSKKQRLQAEEILAAAGEVVWLNDEALMDVVTAISGTGPAYFFLMTEALAAAAESLGLPAETASRLASITCFGAGAMLAANPSGASMLRRQVTSPGGTTQAAIAVLEESRFHELVFRAAEAARDRSKELALK